jgi:hypothetical protein
MLAMIAKWDRYANKMLYHEGTCTCTCACVCIGSNIGPAAAGSAISYTKPLACNMHITSTYITGVAR